MNICLFEPTEIQNPLSSKDERGKHLLKVLHKKEGDTFTAGIIGGESGIAKITNIIEENGEKQIHFTFEATGNGKPLTNLKMIIGFPRPIQLKRLLRDIAALGVSEVHLTGTDLGEKSYMQSNLVEKGAAYKMLLDGTVQAGSTHVPNLFLHKTLEQCIENFMSDEENVLIALDNVTPKSSLQNVLEQFAHTKVDTKSPCKKNVVAAIGSERGWTERERKLLENKGFIRCGMGERIMRTETAATVAGAIILNEMGFLS